MGSKGLARSSPRPLPDTPMPCSGHALPGRSLLVWSASSGLSLGSPRLCPPKEDENKGQDGPSGEGPRDAVLARHAVSRGMVRRTRTAVTPVCTARGKRGAIVI